MVFFDSHGMAWKPCHPNHIAAKDFGPRRTARLLSRAELSALGLWSPDQRPWAIAKAAGRIEVGEEWDTLKE